jgi:poly [ADP-ribose] polymerase
MTLKFVFYNCTENSLYMLLSCSRHECKGAEYIEKLPKNKHSTKGLGRTEPDPKSSVLRKDGVEVPVGKGVSTARNDVSLLYNEYPFVSCWKQCYGTNSM